MAVLDFAYVVLFELWSVSTTSSPYRVSYLFIAGQRKYRRLPGEGETCLFLEAQEPNSATLSRKNLEDLLPG